MSLDTYFQAMGRISRITVADEIALSKIIQAGRAAQVALDAGAYNGPSERRQMTVAIRDADEARHRFITANLRLVVSEARRYPLPGTMDFGDLVQEGNLGLARAVEKFDWQRGFRFSTYAVLWIRQALGRATRNDTVIHVPENMAFRLYSALRAGVTAEQLPDDLAALWQISNVGSLDKPLGDHDSATFADIIADNSPDPFQAFDHSSAVIDDVAVALDVLTCAEATVIRLRHGLDGGGEQSITQIARTLGVSASATRQTYQRALRRMRDTLNAQHADGLAHTG